MSAASKKKSKKVGAKGVVHIRATFNNTLITITDTNGNTKDGLLALLENPNVVSLGEYIGVLIPDFQDAEGNDLYIQDLVNLETAFNGLYCAIDEDLFDGTFAITLLASLIPTYISLHMGNKFWLVEVIVPLLKSFHK